SLRRSLPKFHRGTATCRLPFRTTRLRRNTDPCGRPNPCRVPVRATCRRRFPPSFLGWSKLLLYRTGLGVESSDLAGRAVGRDLSQTEVEDLGVAALGDENVGGFNVAVDDAFAMRGIQAIGDLDGE